ncbi:MAG: SusE domain-containing protein [Bacteroidota bacterium]|nr:SusE domain-containing protein [Bacteroidota bacterium]
MKYLLKLFSALVIILSFAACKKVGELPFYPNGNAVVLSSSVNMISTAPADSNKNVLKLFWTNPKYSQDSSLYKYIVEIDSTGRNFSKEYKIVVTGARDTVLNGKQFNDILAGLGVIAGVPSTVDVRVTSSYGNNNESHFSNVINIKTTPYIVPITATVSPAGPLVLAISNGSTTALSFSWNGTSYGTFPFTYALQMDTAGGNFSNPQVFNTRSGLTQNITVSNLNNAAILAGVKAGTAKDLIFRVVAFQGSNTTPSVISNLTTVNVTTYIPFLYLYVPGDYQGWSPGSAPQLGATSPDLNNFEGYVNVSAGGSYEFKITNAPDWNHVAYGGAPGTLSTSGGNLKWPKGAGYYYVKANPTALTWSALKTSWSIIGDAPPGGWNTDTPLTYDVANNVWVINSVALTSNNLKFRANDDWGINLGGNLSSLNYGGSNISISTAGNYKIVLDLSQPFKYTATLTKL